MNDIHTLETTALRFDGDDADNDFVLTGTGIWLRYKGILLHIWRDPAIMGLLHVDQHLKNDPDGETLATAVIRDPILIDESCPCCVALYEAMT
jgi:hypothetical protein